jgi:hypothetical protein
MFALFEAGLQRNHTGPTPWLRRCAPDLGLTMFNLFEVVSLPIRKNGTKIIPF